MSTKYPDTFQALAEPFHPNDIKSYTKAGRKLSYITARTVMNRLDEVCGPEMWDFELKPWGENALIGTLTIRLGNGEIVRKSDVGGRAQMKDADDDTKSAASDCLKRCGVLFGIGRGLYNDGQVSFGPQKPRDERTRTQRLNDWAAKEGHLSRVVAIARSVYNKASNELSDEQALAIWKLIKDSGAVANVPQPEPKSQPPEEPAAQQPGRNANGNPNTFGWPNSGAALFAWMKALQSSFKTSIVDSVKEGFCSDKLPPEQRWDSDFRHWQKEQIQTAAVYVARLISQFPGYSGEFDKHLPPSLQSLRDKLWEVAGSLAEAMGQQPTSEVIEMEIQRTSQGLAPQFGGEVIGDLEKCENGLMLNAVLEIMESDLKDAKATY